jgi:hypothetical protein
VGKAAAIPKLEVIWPVSRTVQVFQNVPINRVLLIRELDERYTIAAPPHISLAGPTSDR